MDLGMLMGTTGYMLIGESLLLEVREMTPLGRWERVLQVPEACWLLSNCQKAPYMG